MNAAAPAVPPRDVPRGWNWRIFWALEGAGVFGIVAVLPYALTLQAPMLKHHPLPIPLGSDNQCDRCAHRGKILETGAEMERSGHWLYETRAGQDPPLGITRSSEKLQ